MKKTLFLVLVVCLSACSQQRQEVEKTTDDEEIVASDTIRIEAVRETQYILNDSGELEGIDLR